MSLAGFDAMLLDLDGVITRTAVVHGGAWKRLFDEFLRSWADGHDVAFRPFDLSADYGQYVDGKPRYEGVASFLRSRGIDLPYGSPADPPEAETCCGLGNRKNRYFLDELQRSGVEVFDDTVALIDALQKAHKQVAVVSSSANCDATLERAGLLDRLPVRVTGVEAMRLGLAGKPAPDTFLLAAELLGVDPRRAVVFEDAVSGVQAARAGGFGLVVGVDRHDDPSRLLANGADLALSDLTALLPVVEDEEQLADSTLDALLDRTYEAIVVCLGADATSQDLSSLGAAVQEARATGIDVLVLTHDAEGPETLDVALERWSDAGISPGLVLVAGFAPGRRWGGRAARAAVVSVDHRPPGGLPRDGAWIGRGIGGLRELLDQQQDRRRHARVPSVDADPGWTLTLAGNEGPRRRMHQSLLTIGDGRFGTRGAREEEGPGGFPRVVAGGVFDETPDPHALLEGPIWTSLQVTAARNGSADTRVLDLRTGVLFREQPADPVPLRTLRFASLARPGIMGLRAEGGVEALEPGPSLRAPGADGTFVRRQVQDSSTASNRHDRGGSIGAAASQRSSLGGGRRMVERLASYVANHDGADATAEAAARLERASALGFEPLLAEHRAAWAARWRESDVTIAGDPELQLAVRFVLFHLMASAPTSGEAAIGPRGLTGPAYGGHVFWDADVFVLPFLAATCPPAARAMLDYRLARLPAARRAAQARGLEGARFPWESAGDGTDVTPSVAISPRGGVIPILTGQHEEHIVADIAWAALHYAAWTGDEAFVRGPGAPLILDTARYWASRVRIESAGGAVRGHIDGVIGPDEYHELVDDNAYTNVMARWNLREAARLGAAAGLATDEEIRRWRSVADALVDGYDGATGRYEQFAGYDRLEPVLMKDLGETPVAADLLFGRERITRSQVIKQTDVLMLHHLVPEETAAGSLAPNLDFYEPRCAHGSSLSPAIHASLLARAGRPDEALKLFRIACLLDLQDLTGTTASGLHIATFGGVWQALAFGFAGLRPGRVLTADPRLPSSWPELRLRFRYQGRAIALRAGHDTLEIRPEAPVPVEVPGGGRHDVPSSGTTWRRVTGGWEVTS